MARPFMREDQSHSESNVLDVVCNGHICPKDQPHIGSILQVGPIPLTQWYVM